MADVTLDLQNSNPEELYGQGVKAYILQDYETAVRAFSKASELLSEANGSETHDSLGDVYLHYGKSLLELSRRESGPLGEGVPRNVEEESEEEIEEVEGEEGQEKEEKSEAKADKTDGEEAKGGDEEKKEGDEVEAAEEAEVEEADSSTEKKGEEEDLTDLQVAWEVLELAKSIFTARGAEGRKNLAETYIVLGEISLESGNFPSAIEDMSEGLKIQKELFGNDSRTIAETYYKLGGAYSTNAQIDEAIQSFTSSNEYLKNKVASLEKDEEHKDENTEEIEELKGLIPEIEEKIADMKTVKDEIAKKMTASVDETAAKTNGTSVASSSSSSSKKINDISHLVKRKRKEEDASADETPAKKPSP